jgi:hypothetical protein
MATDLTMMFAPEAGTPVEVPRNLKGLADHLGIDEDRLRCVDTGNERMVLKDGYRIGAVDVSHFASTDWPAYVLRMLGRKPQVGDWYEFDGVVFEISDDESLREQLHYCANIGRLRFSATKHEAAQQDCS